MNHLKVEKDADGDLCIWQEDDTPFAFKPDDFEQLRKGLESILYEKSDKFTMTRKEYGSFEIKKSDDIFKVGWEHGHYTCSRRDLERLYMFIGVSGI